LEGLEIDENSEVDTDKAKEFIFCMGFLNNEKVSSAEQ